MRKLASVQRIVDIQPIQDADAIEVAQVLNWKLVTKKGEYAIGDLVIYVEPDSFIPTELAPWLTKEGQAPKEYEGVSGERLRTIKLRGQVSQGLLLPLDFIMNNQKATPYHWNEGSDVTELLGIVKYEPPTPACLSGVVKGAFPSVFPKTDEDRLQTKTNAEWCILKGYTWEITEKLEGSSLSMGMLDNDFIVCTRNLNLTESDNTPWRIARKNDVEAKMRKLGLNNLIIQGEMVGEGIQGGYYGVKGQDVYVFAIYDVVQAQYVAPQARRDLCTMLGLKHVPVVEECFEFMQEVTVDKVLDFADGMSVINPKKLREGLVFKRLDGQDHFKAVSPKYLVKTGG